MLDIQYIRSHPDIVKKAVADKLLNSDIDRLLEVDRRIRETTAAVDRLRAERNKLSRNMSGEARTAREAAGVRGRAIKTKLAALEEGLAGLKREYDGLMLTVPSIPAPEVPLGKGEADNVEIRRWGTLPRFDFAPRDHMAIAEGLDLVDVPRAVKFAGSRSYFLKNEGVLLEMAICRFVLDQLIAKGFTPVTVPLMVKESAMLGTGYFPLGYEQAYRIPEDELFLIGTSEVSLVSYHRNEVLNLEELPRRYAGYSTCFRREAGTYGKDTRGLYRVHQFQKVEQVVIGRADDAEAERLHYEILGNTEAILQALELPYRVALACTGEIGLGQVRKHEVETWMPSRNGYCETHSCSTLNDFQARRSGIRYRDEDGTLRYVYTLNNTGIASPRILIPLLEIYQNEDGSVTVPRVLRPYLNQREKIGPKPR
ncbi:seryl-tRNA synthetase [Hydrogenispora ethanolica]|uniref:Serine--tRNA ligase n=1 Tax=Hydrogenispora ethanolica TaxID=1082276 RepID=A0A4R1QWK1_HYDET|nr:serine--tRNA ligase [Hydrogenispora ethanolica]TCL54750.1 seryl-tRNA synthetase [Hydrogenispora ethanolica]